MPAAVISIAPPLTGDRSYLHGADVFDAIVAATGATADVTLVLKVAGDCAIDLVDPTGLRPGDADVCGSVRYNRSGSSERRLLRRRRDCPITTRIACDEAALTAAAVLGSDGAVVPPAAGASFFRRAVAASLKLLELPYPDDHWAIAEIACRRLPPADAAVDLRLEARLGDRYWTATTCVAEGGETIGTILLARTAPRRDR